MRLSFFFFFKQKTAYEVRISDWSSDVCSSDLTASASDNDSAQYAAAAKALSQDKDGKAIVAAEEAVAANPQDGAYRSLLGQAYLSGGRFASAETSFEDALSLGHADAQTVIGLAKIGRAHV